MVRLRPDWWRRHRWQIESYERHGAAENGSEFQSRHEIFLREISLCALNSFDEEHDTANAENYLSREELYLC